MMAMRHTILLSALFFVVCALAAKNKPATAQAFPPTYVPSGERMYQQFCADCHGADAKGHGPKAYSLKVRPPDLTTLASRHEGKFPYDYVSSMLLFGPGVTAHGSSDMPTWGPIFMFLDKQNEKAVRQRIKNLCNYLVSVQQKSILTGQGF
jgi:mono/diheme cytochrome c family protein